MSKPEPMELTSQKITEEQKAKLRQLFPEVFTEGKVDFDRLKLTLGEEADDGVERYGMSWPGKRDCFKVIQQPSAGTLKPCKAESVNFDGTENLFIEGDNLEALKLLQKSYYGKVKMIYIDPPYNTGKEFIYPDNFKENLDTYLEYTGQTDESGKKFSTNTESEGRFHSKWLNMMYPRLFLARNLLRDDGVIFISIDENEVSNLRKLCDEMFGEENYCGEIIWKNSSKNDQDYISIQHEYILAYVKDKTSNKGLWQEKKEGLDQIYDAFTGFRAKHGNDWKAIHQAALEWYKQFPLSHPISASKHYSWMDEQGVYFPADISGPNFGQYRFDVLHPETKQVCKEPASGWRYPEETMRKRITDKLVHFGDDHTTVPCNKTYLKETEFQSLCSIKFQDSRAASNRLAALFGVKLFTNPKDEILLKDMFKAVGVKGDDIVLDFFAGSGTTFQAVMELNHEQGSLCRSILVQLPEDLRVMEKTATGSSKKAVENAIKYLNELGLPENISEIGKQRARLFIQKLETEAKNPESDLFDTPAVDKKPAAKPGFKVFKLDRSNFKAWQAEAADGITAEAIAKQLELGVDHLDPKSTPDDILYELLMKSGFELTAKVETLKLADKTVYSIAGGALLICLEPALTKEVITAMAKLSPARVLCLDRGFAGNDQLKTNAVQIMKSHEVEDFRTV